MQSWSHDGRCLGVTQTVKGKTEDGGVRGPGQISEALRMGVAGGAWSRSDQRGAEGDGDWGGGGRGTVVSLKTVRATE